MTDSIRWFLRVNCHLNEGTIIGETRVYSVEEAWVIFRSAIEPKIEEYYSVYEDGLC